MKNIPIAICCCLFLGACNHEMQVEAPDFEVSTKTRQIRVGEPVVFEFSGKADYITFYSGEIYSDYEYRDGRIVTPGWDNKLSFSTAITAGVQKDQLSMLVTNSFNGDYNDYNNLVRTDWTDITSWFTLASDKNATPSSAQDISAFVSADRPAYIALRYRTKRQTDHGTASRWVVTDFKLTNRAEEPGEVVLFDLVNAGFRLLDPFARGQAACRSSASQTQVVMQGNLYGPDSEGVVQGVDVETEHWMISRALDLTSPRNLGPDRPVSVKGFSQPDPGGYTHIYNTPGVYNAVFISSNQSLEQQKEVVRSIQIIVNE